MKTQPNPLSTRKMFQAIRALYPGYDDSAKSNHKSPPQLLFEACKENVRWDAKHGYCYSRNVTADAESRAVKVLIDLMQVPSLMPSMKDYFDFPPHTWIAACMIQSKGRQIKDALESVGFVFPHEIIIPE
jgi:hypothetical protein